MGSIVGGLIVGIGFFVGSRLVFDFPYVKKPEVLLFWILGYTISGAFILGATFVILVRRNPKWVRYGAFLVHIITLVLVASFLAVKLMSLLFK